MDTLLMSSIQQAAYKCENSLFELEDTGFGGERGEIIGGNQNVLIANWEAFS